jgi:hypothetical protein
VARAAASLFVAISNWMLCAANDAKERASIGLSQPAETAETTAERSKTRVLIIGAPCLLREIRT